MSEQGVTGANPDSAHARGADGVTVAETFTDLVSKFGTATEELATATKGPFEGDTVGLDGAYSQFAEDYVTKMRDVQEHGRRLSGNVQAGAIAVSDTDGRAAVDYGELGVTPERQSFVAQENQEYVNRHLNEYIDERYAAGEVAVDDVDSSSDWLEESHLDWHPNADLS